MALICNWHHLTFANFTVNGAGTLAAIILYFIGSKKSEINLEESGSQWKVMLGRVV